MKQNRLKIHSAFNTFALIYTSTERCFVIRWPGGDQTGAPQPVQTIQKREKVNHFVELNNLHLRWVVSPNIEHHRHRQKLVNLLIPERHRQPVLPAAEFHFHISIRNRSKNRAKWTGWELFSNLLLDRRLKLCQRVCCEKMIYNQQKEKASKQRNF